MRDIDNETNVKNVRHLNDEEFIDYEDDADDNSGDNSYDESKGEGHGILYDINGEPLW